MAQLQRAAAPYAQIAQHLRDEIHAGRLAPGDRVPSVRDLAAEWGVSRATADKALSALRSEGLVTAVTGVGTQVADQVQTVQTGGIRFRRLMSTGRATRVGERSEILSAELLSSAPADVAAALKIEPGSSVIRRQRRFHDEDGIAALSTSWLAGTLAEQVPVLLGTGRIEGGTIGAVCAATGRQPAPGLDTARARLATDDEAEALGLEQPIAVLIVEARLADEDGVPIEFGVDVIGPDRPWSVGYDLSLP
ncbi:GntR family transcriptional regulator (plasmid) [Actinomadura graeca]|uniref:GntR family transcriptional regulator n=1 Tax=Actinomadura graeca TaxID=2750812 RepID=A0ABX8RDM1_9ACTN|nr:GntR family transcriptional regulator [Actinomadura graeca]QXJ27083.1 GntR family transcriptional regulator [Actinomadura graeca]